MEISRRLIEKGHEVTIITEQFSKNEKSFERYKHVDIYRIPVGGEGKGKKFRIWQWLWRQRKLLQEADLVHCHDVFFWYLPFRFLYPGKPVYTTFHGYESYPIAEKTKFVRKISEKLSWANICIGDFITKWYGTKPSYVSYGAVTAPSSKNKVLRPKKNSALFFGRLDEQTGIQMYAKAVAHIKKKIPDFNFLIIGEGKYKKSLAKKFTGRGFQRNPEKYFATYHFAFVSGYLSILEAFSAKRLVFAVYDNPLKEDYLRMAPFAKWIVIAGDEKELAGKIMYYLKHPDEEKELINKAAEWAKKQTWEKMIAHYLLLWKKTGETL